MFQQHAQLINALQVEVVSLRSERDAVLAGSAMSEQERETAINQRLAYLEKKVFRAMEEQGESILRVQRAEMAHSSAQANAFALQEAQRVREGAALQCTQLAQMISTQALIGGGVGEQEVQRLTQAMKETCTLQGNTLQQQVVQAQVKREEELLTKLSAHLQQVDRKQEWLGQRLSDCFQHVQGELRAAGPVQVQDMVANLGRSLQQVKEQSEGFQRAQEPVTRAPLERDFQREKLATAGNARFELEMSQKLGRLEQELGELRKVNLFSSKGQSVSVSSLGMAMDRWPTTAGERGVAAASGTAEGEDRRERRGGSRERQRALNRPTPFRCVFLSPGCCRAIGPGRRGGTPQE